jgi:hypothetical protein
MNKFREKAGAAPVKTSSQAEKRAESSIKESLRYV